MCAFGHLAYFVQILAFLVFFFERVSSMWLYLSAALVFFNDRKLLYHITIPSPVNGISGLFLVFHYMVKLCVFSDKSFRSSKL